MIGVVGANGKLYFRFKVAKKEGIQATDVAAFLRQLLRHEDGQVVVFWDGATQHKGPAIRNLLHHQRRLRLIRLPPYGYDYNPSEGPWQYLKWVALKNFNPQNTPELVRVLRRGLRRMQRRRGLVRSFFRQSKLPRRGIDCLLNHYRML